MLLEAPWDFLLCGVLMAVTIGGSLMGVVGMLIFIPLVSVLYALFREWMYKRLKSRNIQIKD